MLRLCLEGTKGSQGMGVVSNSCLDRVLLSILYIFKPSCSPMLKPPSLGPPLVHLRAEIRPLGLRTYYHYS